MADLRGTWVPDDEAEEEFLLEVHAAVQQAHDRGVDTDSIVAGMNFLSASALMHEGSEDVAIPEPEPSEKRETCPRCGGDIEGVRVLGLGGRVEVQPCKDLVDHDQVEGWIDMEGDR